MGRFSRSRGLLYFMILMVLVVILVRMFSLGTSNVKELNSQQFLAAVRTHQGRLEDQRHNVRDSP